MPLLRPQKGFLIPYIVALDEQFGSGRWIWWLRRLLEGRIPAVELPRIEFAGSSRDNPRTIETRKHLEACIDYLGYRHGAWKGMYVFLDWILYGLGKGDSPIEVDDSQHEWLYRNFNAGYLIRSPYDYWGAIISEYKASGWNPTGFYPTPQHVVKLMVDMQMEGRLERGIFSKVCDPAVGTGRMLLESSKHALFLYGMDIDILVYKACLVNMFLYVPWAALPVESIEEPPYYHVPERVRLAAEAYLALTGQLYRELAEAREKPVAERAPKKKKQRAA